MKKKDIHLTSIPYSKDLGVYFKEKRKSAGLKQGDLARVLGFSSPQFVSNVERGICAYSTDHLKVVARTCQIDYNELIGILLSEYRSYLKDRLQAIG